MISAARRSNIDGRSRKSNREWPVPSGSNPLRVVFYCRVSTDDQRDAGTVENQLSYLRLKYAVDFGPHAIKPMAFISDFVDDGISGTLPLHEREAGRALLEGARRGDFDAVIVYKLDRLGRTARVIVDAADELAKSDIALVSATEPIDTAPNADPFMQAVGRFIFSLLASLAEFDRATMLGRTSMGVRRLANQGKFISGPIPFGFAIGADGFLQPSEQLVDPLGSTEAELVVDIFRRVADGQSSQKVATWLNRIGVPATKRYWKKELQRAVHAPAGALGWSAVRVRRMIHSSVYKGVRERLVANSVILNELPFALVDPALWDAANYSIAEPSVSLRWRTRGSDPFLLGGMIYCTACADSTVNAQRRVYTGWTATRSSGKYVYYRCSGAAHHAEGGYARCPSSNIPGETLEAAVIAAVGARIRQPESTIEALREAVRARLGVAADTKGRRERIEAKLHEKERARGQIRAGLRSGALTADEVEADLDSHGVDVRRVGGSVGGSGRLRRSEHAASDHLPAGPRDQRDADRERCRKAEGENEDRVRVQLRSAGRAFSLSRDLRIGVCAGEEHQVARFELVARNAGGCGVLQLRGPRQRDTHLAEDQLHQARAVQAGGGI